MKQNTQPFVLGSFGTGMTITCFTGYESKFLDCKELPAYFKKQLVHQMGTYIAGWLSIAGISSDHPVMQSRSPFSPTHFEKYDCWNRPDLAGCIHIDSRVMTSAAYLPILFPRYPYDNITNALVKYQSLDFARQHPIINFESIKGGESRYKLAAVFTEAQSDPLHRCSTNARRGIRNRVNSKKSRGQKPLVTYKSLAAARRLLSWVLRK